MPSTCCVGGCKSNYASEIKRTGETVTVFVFPRDENQRELWFNSLPNVVEDTPAKRICVKHWPPGYKITWRMGSEVPDEVPSVFQCSKIVLPSISQSTTGFGKARR